MEVWNEYTTEEVALHKSESDCWLIIGVDGAKRVYDVTAFLEDHPGGPELLLDLAGQDAQDEFHDIGHSSDAHAMLDELCIGVLKEELHARAVREARKMERLSLLKQPDQVRLLKERPTYSRLFVGLVGALLAVGVAVTLARLELLPKWLTSRKTISR